MFSRKLPLLLWPLVLIGPLNYASARSFNFDASPLVRHPVTHPLERTGGVWRSHSGIWGENLAEETLRLRGYNEIYEIKNASNNGIDRIALKRLASGELLDAKLVEVKTSRALKPKLGSTRYGGEQMSREWLSENFKRMRNSGDPAVKKLALEISRLIRKSDRPIEEFGELIHIDTSRGVVTGYSANGGAVKYEQSIEQLLQNIAARGKAPSREWALRSLAELDQIRSTNMTDWLGESASSQSSKALLRSEGVAALAAREVVLVESRSTIAARLLRRSAGKAAIIVALAIDAKELWDTENAYRQGAISVRQRNIRLVSSAGGITFAWAGAEGGAVMRAWIGSFGGPIRLGHCSRRHFRRHTHRWCWRLLGRLDYRGVWSDRLVRFDRRFCQR